MLVVLTLIGIEVGRRRFSSQAAAT
jgi:hypothetical protein